MVGASDGGQRPSRATRAVAPSFKVSEINQKHGVRAGRDAKVARAPRSDARPRGPRPLLCAVPRHRTSLEGLSLADGDGDGEWVDLMSAIPIAAQGEFAPTRICVGAHSIARRMRASAQLMRVLCTPSCVRAVQASRLASCFTPTSSACTSRCPLSRCAHGTRYPRRRAPGERARAARRSAHPPTPRALAVVVRRAPRLLRACARR